MIEKRPSLDRGHAHHGWLDSYHSFSFGDYHDPAHMNWGALRVLNEDRVAPGEGFAAHGHRDMEIISYVISGALSHRDNLGNGAMILPGDVQRMSAGQGVVHSEFNPSDETPVHFLQIWITPSVIGLPPSYEQRNFPNNNRRGVLRLVASPDPEDDCLHIHQDARVYASLLTGSDCVLHRFESGRLGYLQIVRGEAKLNGQTYIAGDGARISGEPRIDICASGDETEVLLFDLPLA